MDKSYVTLVQRKCILCDREYDTNELLLDRRLRNTFERYTVVGMGICPSCKEETREGFIMMIEIDEKKSEFDHQGQPISIWKTGKIIHLKREHWSLFFNHPGPVDGFGFLSIEAAERLEQIYNSAVSKEGEDNENN